MRNKANRLFLKPLLKFVFFTVLSGLAGNISAEPLSMEGKSPNASAEKNTPPLVIALRNDSPPLTFLNVEGQPAGLFVDMWRLWAEKTGQKIEFQSAAFQDSLDSLKKGAADIHGLILYSEDRREWLSFSQPIYELNLYFFFRKQEKIGRLGDLKGRKVGVIQGTNQEEQLRKRYPGIEVVPFASNEEMIRASLKGKILAFLSTPMAISIMLRQLGLPGEFASLDERFFTGTFHAGVLKNNKKLASLIERGLNLISQQELAEIEQRWVSNPDHRYYHSPRSSSPAEGQKGRGIPLTPAEETWLKAHKTLKIGIPAVFPPLMFLGEDKSFQGIVRDYLDFFTKRTGIRFEPVYASLTELPELMQTRQTDLFPAFVDPLPNPFVDFTDTCFALPWVIVNRIADPFIRDVNDLSGMKVSVVKDIPLYNLLMKNHPGIDVYPFDTPVAAMKSVESGNTDAFAGAFVVAGYVMQKYRVSNLKIAGQTGYEDFSFKFAVRGDWPELVGILNKVIFSVPHAEQDRIFQKWMPVRYEHTVMWQTVIHWVLWVGGILGTLSGIMLFWNRKLAKEILQRQKVELALRDNEAQFRLVFEKGRDAVFWADAETGIIVKCNAKAEELSERPREELIGMHQLGLHPSDRDYREIFLQAVNTQPTPDIYGEVLGSSGKITPVLISTTVVTLASRRIIQGIFHDISERKQIEAVQVFLAKTSTGTQGETFFEMLARYLGQSLNMDFVCIDRLEGDGLTARTVSVWCDGKFEDNVTHALKDTPRGEVVGKTVCCFPSSVCRCFPNDPVLLDLRAESYAGVTLFGFSGKPVGLIAVIGRRPLEKQTIVESTLKLVSVRAAAELERLDAEAALRGSLAEKEVLLKEVHHRVKNNLAAIMGLLDLERQTLADEAARTALTELSSRIRSMALVHEQLYRSEDFSRIDFKAYLDALVAHLYSSYVRSGDIHVSISAESLVMGLDNAVPCGLLITELMTNAFKYAFPAGRPREGACNCAITISAEWDGAAYTLIVADNGVGLPADLDWMKANSLGLVLVRMLGQHQLQGRIELDRDGGTTFRLRFTPKGQGKGK
ncbi:MAG: transporter substrate-binding domain-containing protein [Pseudomonadota bacterium]